MSILAPVYVIYGVSFEIKDKKYVGTRLVRDPLPPEMQRIADILARKLEATFQVSALPREVLDAPVALCVDSRQPPETTLFHALFTSEPQSVP